jgi:hypothetical protein
VTAAAAEPAHPSDEDLRRALEQVLSEFFGRHKDVSRVTRRPWIYRSSFSLESLEVEFSDGQTLRVMFKDLSPHALSSAGRSAKPSFLLDPGREIHVYRKVIGPCGIGAPVCYGAVVDPDVDRYWLFLELAPGVGLYQIGDIDVWKRVARWLCGVHATLAPHLTRFSQEIPLLRFDGQYFGTWADRAMAALASDVDAAGPGRGRLLKWLRERHARLVARLMDLPLTIVHGELYASSIIVDQHARDGIRAVDWEMAAIGTGLIDLAALTSGNWDEAQRAEMARAYWVRGMRRGTTPWPFEEFMTSLDLCRLQLAIQWLGWSSAWVPPPQQSHNWMAEALWLIEQVEI